MNTEKENIRNELNLELRRLLVIIELIDGEEKKYENYQPNSLNEDDYLKQQIKLAKDARERLEKIFK